uniref:Splicing regulator RBM11 n=1 Tax=Melopsittacus undulatus TaxID=13146 RepID=A0A8V5G9B0_MELUD
HTAAAEVDQTLFVGNLESRVREEILYELFLQAGPLIKVTICKDKEGKPKSFGFVCFKHKESVPYAVALLNGIRLYGRPIRVQFRFGTFSHQITFRNQGVTLICSLAQRVDSVGAATIKLFHSFYTKATGLSELLF